MTFPLLLLASPLVEPITGGLFRVKRTRNRPQILLQRTPPLPVASRVLEEAAVVEEVVLAVVVPQPVVVVVLPALDTSMVVLIPRAPVMLQL